MRRHDFKVDVQYIFSAEKNVAPEICPSGAHHTSKADPTPHRDAREMPTEGGRLGITPPTGVRFLSANTAILSELFGVGRV